MDGEREYEWEEREGVLVRKRLIKDLWENACDLRVVSRLLAPRRWFRASGEEGRRRRRPLSGSWAVGEEPADGATLVLVRNNVISQWASVVALRWMWFLATRSRRRQKKNDSGGFSVWRDVRRGLKSQINLLVMYGSADICLLIIILKKKDEAKSWKRFSVECIKKTK